MRLIQLRLCHVLLITTTILYITEGIKEGCADWRLHGTDEVCCTKCNPGNRLVEQCGRDLKKLCTPCEPNTYTDLPASLHCRRCTQCVDPKVQLKPCNASADTVCGCKPGFRCGDQQCAFCVKECKEGQEPTEDWTCRKCPEGKFNDEIHSTCKPWTKSCPEGEHIISSGNEFSDIKCSRTQETSRLAAKDNFIYPLIGIFGGSSAIMIILILSLWLAYKRTKTKSKSKDAKPHTPSQGELTIMMVEHDEACSFHQPEQEQGGSSESINTQDSETKLIV
ncbi:hypothetical protein PGIGA_G00072480 [Pangasianodon gigas]|uniref:Uncharacterized protein n=1 Tax=Pangasianodon gigas TaxID=30993 RepID=A0ACC5X8M8_PANGG|nr:hypothetical protein [Pangasianodon gigas]